MSQNRKIIVAFTIFVLLAIVDTLLPVNDTNAQARKKQSSSMPKSEPNAILVQSVPSGLKVYFGPDAEQSDSSKGRYVSVLAKHPIIADKYFKGTTPALVRNVKSGKYLLGISPIRIRDPNKKLQYIDRTLKVRAIVAKIPYYLDDTVEEDIMGAVVYSLIKQTKDPHRVVVIAFHPASIAKLDSLYPPVITFQFDESKYLDELKQRADMQGFFSDDERLKIVDLLRRGGKLFLSKGDFVFQSEITHDGKWTFELKVGIPEK